MKPLGQLPYNRDHYFFPRTCPGFVVQRAHWLDRHRDKLVFVVAVIVGVIAMVVV